MSSTFKMSSPQLNPLILITHYGYSSVIVLVLIHIAREIGRGRI